MGKIGKHNDLFVIVVIFMVALFFEYRETFSLIEDETLSYRQLLRTYNADANLTSPSDDIVIVYTDEEFYEEYDKYPLRRVDLSTILIRLKEMGASVIAVDMLLDFKSAYGEDPSLEDAFIEAGNALLVSQAQFENEEFVGVNYAIDRFSKHTSNGYSNISSNSAVSQSIVRLRVYPEIAKSGQWPFAVEAVSQHLGVEPELVGRNLAIGDIEVPLDPFNDLYIDYPLLPSDGEGGTVRLHDVIGLSAADVLFAEDEEELEELSFLVEDKIVLIGEVAEVAHDEFETPVGNVYGVEIIADTISTILRSAPLRAASFWIEGLVALLMLSVMIVSRGIDKPLPRNALSFVAVLLFITVACLVYINIGLVLSISYTLLASLLAIIVINGKYYLNEMGQKALIRDAFGQYLSPKVVADLVKDPEKLVLGGEEREMTAFFSDIAGFSSFSEKMTPTELVNALNDYLTSMCSIIVDLEGTIDKFEGDAVIAFWGAPAVQAEHAKLSCFGSIDMQREIKVISERFVREGRPAISVRMGVNSGPMVVGNMGSMQRMDYTMMGDAVNLAARLEGANKAYGSDIMITDATYRACEDHVEVRELDYLRVVGKQEVVHVYQLIDRKGQTTGALADMMVEFEKAHSRYRALDFEQAINGYKKCLELVPDDGPSRVFLNRCESYLTSPPPQDWDGVFTLTEKG